jgi:hypothetical protein
MLLTPTIQLTIYLYWDNYPEFRNIKKAVKFTQKIYLQHYQIDKMIALSKKWAKSS